MKRILQAVLLTVIAAPAIAAVTVEYNMVACSLPGSSLLKLS